MSRLTPSLLLLAYRQGIFPMADPDQGNAVLWFAPDPRALIPLDARFRVPRSLRPVLRRGTFRITTDRAFEAVIRACAAPRADGERTWISPELIEVYTALHREGYAHSVECWDGDDLAGGLYGVALGGAFFGESMFHRRRDASKVALVHLVERLRAGGFVLLDTQFLTEHLARFGAYEVPRAHYERLLAEALRVRASWDAIDCAAP